MADPLALDPFPERDEEDLEVQSQDGEITIRSHSRCKIGCPQDTILALEAVHGDARVRRIDGPITVGSLYGDSLFKDVGAMVIESASGDVRVRTVNGNFQLDQASGDTAVRSVDGDIRITQVSGDLSVRGVKGSLSCDAVSGDLSVRGADGLVACASDVGSRRPFNISSGVGYGVSISSNGGLSWTTSNDGLGNNLNVYDLAMHSSNPEVLYAAVLACKPNNGKYFSGGLYRNQSETALS